MKSWQSSRIETRKRRKIVSKLLLKQTIVKWRQFIKEKNHHEQIFIQIVFNRWKCLVEDRIERRKRHEVVLHHRVQSLSRNVFFTWLGLISDRKGMLRTPRESMSKELATLSSGRGRLRYLQNDLNQIKFHQRTSHRIKPWTTISKHNFVRYNPTCRALRNSVVGDVFPRRRLDFTSNSIPIGPHLQRLDSFNPRSTSGYYNEGLNISVKSKSSFKLDHSRKSYGYISPGKLRTKEGGNSYIRRPRPMEELLLPTSSLSRVDDGNSQKSYLPSWILKDLHEHETSHSRLNVSRRMNLLPQDNHDILSPFAESKDAHWKGNKDSKNYKDLKLNSMFPYPDSKEVVKRYCSRQNKSMVEYKS